MVATAQDKLAILLLNDVPDKQFTHQERNRVFTIVMKRVRSPPDISVLVLGAAGDKVGSKVGTLFGADGKVRVTQTDVTFPVNNTAPIVNGNVSLQDLKLDTTTKFTVDKRVFDLVLGRAIVCRCGTNAAGGPCGFPALEKEAAKFLRRVGKSLTPNGVAYLHGDNEGMKPSTYQYWQAAQKECQQYPGKNKHGGGDDRFTVDLVLDETDFVGIKVTRGAT